jgi:endonuclease/exonuclease/phosphatase (EEP) superfamily protein YafD
LSCDGLIEAVAMIALLGSWIGLLGDLHWFLDLFSHFRWQYLLVSAVATAWAAWRGRRKTLVMAMLTFLLNALLIGRLAWHPELSRERLANEFSLRVLSLNVLTSNPNKQAVVEHVLASNADVVFLMEANGGWIAALEPLKARYPHEFVQPREDNFGIALFSRIPWERVNTIWMGDAYLPSVEAQFSHQGREFVFIGTHPLPPVGGDYARSRDNQLRGLADHVSEIGKPALVMGDLNATPWSAGMRLLTAEKRLGFRSLVGPWSPTWRAGSIFAIPIDHALCTAPLVITERMVGEDVGSDHRPLQITVGWEK